MSSGRAPAAVELGRLCTVHVSLHTWSHYTAPCLFGLATLCSSLTFTLPPSPLTVTPHPLCMTWSRSTCSSTNQTQRCTGRRAMHCTTWQRGAQGRVSAKWPTASQHGSSRPAPPLLCNTTRKVWPLFDTSTLVSMSGRHSSPTAQLIHTVHLCACVYGLACLLL